MILVEGEEILFTSWDMTTTVAFPVAAARIWNSLPDHVTSAPSVAVFRSGLKTHLFNISYPSPLYSACAVTLSCFWHYNRSCLLTYCSSSFSAKADHREQTDEQ